MSSVGDVAQPQDNIVSNKNFLDIYNDRRNEKKQNNTLIK